MKSDLPEYSDPPVIEVALSVQFERLDLPMARLGFVWEKFRKEFPEIEEKPELDSVTEQFAPQGRRVPGVRFEMGSVPSPRLWFKNKEGTDLVQIQRDRFIRNWRKTDDQPDYPRYTTIRDDFVKDWNTFSSFVAECSEETLKPNQCEVTYVNIIEDCDSSKLESVIEWVGGSYSDDYLERPEEADLHLRYLLRDDHEEPWGRLHIAASPAYRRQDNAPVIRLSLTARGAPKTCDLNGSMQLMDNEHEAIVRAFTSITTADRHKAWGRKV